MREARSLSDALTVISKGLKIRLKYDDPDCGEKMIRIREAVVRNRGALPVYIEVVMPHGDQVEVDLGPTARVAVSVSFLSELSKIVPQSDTAFSPNDAVYLDPPERKPWES